ncbi:MAG TPA: ATP-binding protein [Clostridiales bacterium]|nr:ATP-binding protein [Clostridiales bacterium]
MEKRFMVFAGNYGSGKTEISLNMALRAAEKGQTTLCDMDVVNPYFRSAESGKMLKEHGVKLIAPPFANTTVDVPALSAEVHAAFESDYAIFDAGGDPVGAIALGRYHEYFEAVRGALKVYYVVNARRPFQSEADEALVLLDQIQKNARLPVDALINNTNLAGETTVDDLLYGELMCGKITEETGIPVAFAAGSPNVLRAYQETGYRGDVLELTFYTRLEWME